MDGINPALYANVVPFRPPTQPTPATRTEAPEAVQAPERSTEARGPQRRPNGVDAKLAASAASRTAAEVAAMQMMHGLGPGLRAGLPRVQG